MKKSSSTTPNPDSSLKRKLKDEPVKTGELSKRELQSLVQELKTLQSGLEAQNAELRRTESLAIESEERYRSLVELSPDAILVHVGDTYVYANPAAVKLFGATTPDEITGKKVLDLIHPGSRDFVKEQMRRVNVEKAQLRDMEGTCIRLDGSPVDVEATAAPVIYMGKPAGQVILRDVSERKHAEISLQEKQHFIERITEATPDILYIFDVSEGRLVYANNRLKKHLGYSLEDIRQMGGAIFQEIIHPDDIPMIAAYRAQGAKDPDGKTINVELRVRHVNGEWRWLQTKSVVFSRDSEGVTRQVLGTARDVTEQKILENELMKHRKFLMELVEERTEELQRSNEDLRDEISARVKIEAEIIELNRTLEQRVKERTAELETVNKELEAYSYTVSHDLKSPLRSIEGFINAILEDYADKLDETGKDYCRRVHAASRRMSQLIDALLTMSRLTHGEIMEKVVDLSAIAEVAAHELQRKQPERHVEFIIAREVRGEGDMTMLQAVIENLFDNAWKFTSRNPSATIEFGVMDDKGQKVYFVRDNGAGFQMEFADKLFKPFMRMHSESEFPGIGIGLATVQRIINRHGGKVRAESSPGKGATFYFTLG